MTQVDFNKKVSVVIVYLAQITWALAKIRIHELSDDPATAPLSVSLKNACNKLITHLKDLGVKTETFEEFDISQEAKKNPNN